MTSSTGATTCSASEPLFVFVPGAPLKVPRTVSPTARPLVPPPTASTIPAKSRPTRFGKLGMNHCAGLGMALAKPTSRRRGSPLKTFSSIGLSAAALTAIRVSPSRGSGAGTSTISNTSGPPNLLYSIALLITSSSLSFVRQVLPAACMWHAASYYCNHII